jgi:type I restriction enzyme S subunit
MNKAQTMEKTKETKAYKYKPSGIEWLGDIPEHWEQRKLRNILALSVLRNQPDLPLLSVVREKGIIKRDTSSKDENHNYIPEDLTNYKVVKAGQFAMNKMKAWQGSYGVSKYDGIVSPAYHVFNLEKVTPDFFHIAIRSKAYVPFFGQASDGVRIGQWDLSLVRMREIPFLIPPIEEQNQIAQYLDYKTKQINRFIKNKQKLIKLLKEQKQNIINQAVIEGTNKNVSFKPSGIEWLGDIPVHWEMRKVKNVCSLVGSGTTPTSGQMKFYNGSVPWVTTSELRENTILNTKSKITEEALNIFSALKLFPPQSLLIAMYGATIGRIGILGIEASTNQACCALVLSKSIKVEFAFYWFLSQKPHLVNLSYGGGQPNISQEKIKSFPIPLPPIEEQKAIVEYIEKETAIIDKAIERTEREIELIKEYKTTLISEVVTGKLPPSRLLGGNLEEIEINDEEIESEENLDEELVEREEEETN